MERRLARPGESDGVHSAGSPERPADLGDDLFYRDKRFALSI
jgi:hypothetical protein